MKASKCKHYRFCNKQDWSSNQNAKINGKELQQSSEPEGKVAYRLCRSPLADLTKEDAQINITTWKCRPHIYADVQETWHGKSWRVIDTILVHAIDMKLWLLDQIKDPGRTRGTGTLQKHTASSRIRTFMRLCRLPLRFSPPSPTAPSNKASV